MDYGLEGKVVLVTGSTGGIGKAIAQTFLKVGAKVIVNGRNEERTAAVATELGKAEGVTGTCHAVAADLSSAEGCEALFKGVAEVGELHVLVNNMGIFETKEFTDIDDERWLHYLNVNLMSVVRTARYYLPKLLEANNHGRIINIASEAGWRQIPDMIHYSTTKTAVIGLSRGLALLTKGKNVTVNSVAAGPTMTSGVRGFIAGLAEESKTTPEAEVEKFFTEREPTSLIKRFLKVEEVAQPVLFLASRGAAGVNGTSQRAEGGIIPVL